MVASSLNQWPIGHSSKTKIGKKRIVSEIEKITGCNFNIASRTYEKIQLCRKRIKYMTELTNLSWDDFQNEVKRLRIS